MEYKIIKTLTNKAMSMLNTKVFTALGIPGLFAYIFYLLMDRFKFSFKSIDGTWSAIIALSFIFSASILTWFALYKFSGKHKDKIDIQKDESDKELLKQEKYPEYGDISVKAFDKILKKCSKNLYHSVKSVRGILLPYLVSIPITPYSHDSVHHSKEIF